MNKTNAMRLLDAAGIPYEAKEYEYDENVLAGVHIAESLGLDPDTVFKTLVARGDKTPFVVFCIPCAYELDLKKCARVSGNKRVELLAVKELLGVTGYIRGGCSPLAGKKHYPVFVDESAILHERIYVSAGHRGVQLRLAPDDLLRAVEGTYAAIARY